MVIVIGKIVAKPDSHDAVIAVSTEHCARSRAEEGCLAHTVSQDCEDPNRFTFVEYWADMAALRAHFAVPASQNFVKALGPHLADAPDMQIFEAQALKSAV